MRFVLEVNFDTETMQEQPLEQLQHVLRSLANHIELYPMEHGVEGEVFDTRHEGVGEWALLDD
ncbi:hypothetical protein [Glutamicibacter sp. PS]|uniref:hypothetical protein n=1 Tax=Glutamicibacter TaxID=1742989 RepID=UPI00284D4400|nr:hypothetical protein [Glutamicibacter sp. PS]MDR4534172.1 hypothetical protein [Glutamicibacter sp. PS]